MDFTAAITEGISTITNVLVLFTKEPAVYFTALAFTSAAAGVARKFVPMKKR